MTEMRETPQVVKEEVLISGYGKRVIKRWFKDPDGKTREFVLWGGKVTPVIILPVTSDKKIIAIEVFRRAPNEYLIEIPGGNPKNGESIEVCGRRELLAETGYTAGEIVNLGPALWLDPASCFTPFVPLLALNCQKIQKQELEETEKTEIKEPLLIEQTEWLKMIHRGEIRDSKTIAITFLALPYLKKL